MSDSAMLSAGAVRQAADQRKTLRAAVIAGPAGVGTLDEQVTGHLASDAVENGISDVISQAATTGRVDLKPESYQISAHLGGRGWS